MEQPGERPVLAIDIGGTRIRSALTTPDAGVQHRREIATEDERGVEFVIARICELANAVAADARATGGPEPVGVGISCPGPLDPWGGVVVAPPNLAGWRDVPLAAEIAGATGLPAYLERDTNVAVIAESRHGAARGTRNAVYVTVSTGVGGGVIVDGRLVAGPDGTAGEVGHTTVELDGPICGCGGRGHVEAIASGTALARTARTLLADGAAPALARLAASGDEVDAALLARAADEGDAACLAALERGFTAVGAACASLVNLLNPEVIVLGGSIAMHRPRLLDVVREQIASRAFPTPAATVRVQPSQFGDDVSLVGAVSVVNDRLGDPAYTSHPTTRSQISS